MGKPRKKPPAAAATESQFLATVADVWPLHLKRKPEREIAKELGIPKTTVHRAIERARQLYRAGLSAEDNQTRIDERRAGLEALLALAWKALDPAPDPAWATVALKAEGELRKMFGDDAPQQIESKSLGGVVILSREEMYAEMQNTIQRIQGKKNGTSVIGTDGSREAL